MSQAPTVATARGPASRRFTLASISRVPAKPPFSLGQAWPCALADVLLFQPGVSTHRPPIHRALSLAASLRRRTPRDEGTDGPAPSIDSVAFGAATIRSGGMAVATIRGANLERADVLCEALSSGFIVDVVPQHTVQAEGEQLVLAMRIFRRIGTPRGLCLVRVSMGDSSAVASITVRV